MARHVFQTGNKINLGRKHTKETREKMSEAHKGIKKTEEWKKKLGDAKRGKKRPPLSREWKKNLSESMKKNGHFPPVKHGKDHPRWKGGVTSANNLLRSSKEYKLWRQAVYSRDGYACVWCGAKGTGANLQADHIKPFALFPELRFAIDNGRTLCKACHKTTSTYGNRKLK
jgi:hypothetical protein